MEILISIYTKNVENQIQNLFGGKKRKEINLDRAKLRFLNHRVEMERPDVMVYVMITLLTSFGAASLSNYFYEKLQNMGFMQIEIGSKKCKILKEEIRQSLLEEYSKFQGLDP